MKLSIKRMAVINPLLPSEMDRMPKITNNAPTYNIFFHIEVLLHDLVIIYQTAIKEMFRYKLNVKWLFTYIIRSVVKASALNGFMTKSKIPTRKIIKYNETETEVIIKVFSM